MESLLPRDIIWKILSHVPPESTLECKLTSKTWNELLSHRKAGLGLLFSIAYDWDRNVQLYYCDSDKIKSSKDSSKVHEQNIFSCQILSKIKHPGMNKREHYIDTMVGSCNGLVCFSVPHHEIIDPVYICNPFTGEYFNLPRLNCQEGLIVSGFGYLNSRNTYKVVRVHYPNRSRYFEPPSVGRVQIYTLGGGTGWRDIGEIDYLLCFEGTLMNESLHWLDSMDWKIVAFDLADEKFRLLPTVPPCFDGKRTSRYRLKLLGGNLCVIHLRGENVDIWSFKNKHNKANYHAEDGYESWYWSLEFRIPCLFTNNDDYYEPMTLTKRNEVLLWYNSTTLCLYDPKSGVLNKIIAGDSKLDNFQAIPHRNSFVSLRALGIRSKKIEDKTTFRSKIGDKKIFRSLPSGETSETSNI